MQWTVVCVSVLPDVLWLHLFGEKLHAQGASTENVTEVRKQTGRQRNFEQKASSVLKWNKVVFSHFLVCSPAQSLEWEAGRRRRDQLTLQKAQARPPGRTAGRTGSYPATQSGGVLIFRPPRPHLNCASQSHSLYRRSLARCNPFLPSPWGLVSRCAEDCRDPPCSSDNHQFSLRSRQRKQKNVQRKRGGKYTYVLILTCHS